MHTGLPGRLGPCKGTMLAPGPAIATLPRLPTTTKSLPALSPPSNLQGYFDITLQAAAVQLGVGVTTLKKASPGVVAGGRDACSSISLVGSMPWLAAADPSDPLISCTLSTNPLPSPPSLLLCSCAARTGWGAGPTAPAAPCASCATRCG